MANDNTLGAPTEGLGQKVTFAFDPANSGVPQLGAPGRGSLQAGVRGDPTRGAGQTQAAGVRVEEDPTMRVLMKVAGTAVKAHMERKKTEAFVTGMQRAMQGEAVADIAAEQPWYSTLFGESDVVEGARAYTGHTVAQTAVAAMEDKMPELRKMSPTEAQQYFVESVNSRLTGDKPTDAAILQSMTRALPSVMRRQAKEHYGWQQENAVTAEAAAFKAGASRLQSMASGIASGHVTPDEYKGEADAFVRSLVPAAGRDEKGYKDSMAANLAGWAQEGNFHALNAVRERGFFDVLDPSQRNAVERAVEVGESKLRVRYSDEWADKLAGLEYDATVPAEGDTPQALESRINAVNEAYKAATGSQAGLILPGSKAALMKRSGVAIAQERARQAGEAQREAARVAKAGAKAEAAALTDAQYAEAVKRGYIGDLVRQPGYTPEGADMVLVPMAMGKDVKPEDRNALLVGLRGYVSPRLKAGLSARMQGAVLKASSAQGYTPDVQAAFDEYLQLYAAAPSVAAAYYDGPDSLGTRLEGFAAAVVDRKEDPVAAYTQYMTGPVHRKSLPKAEAKEAIKAVAAQFNGWKHLWMGDNALKPGQDAALVREIEHDAAVRYGTNGENLTAAVERTLSLQTQKGLEITGGYVFRSAPGQTSLKDYLSGVAPNAKRKPGEQNVPTDKINDEFSDAVEALMYGDKDMGLTGVTDEEGSIRVIRYPDTNGVPTFRVMSHQGAEIKSAIFTADEIPKHAAQRRAAKAKWQKSVTAPAPHTDDAVKATIEFGRNQLPLK
jgi:hypothetical protein